MIPSLEARKAVPVSRDVSSLSVTRVGVNGGLQVLPWRVPLVCGTAAGPGRKQGLGERNENTGLGEVAVAGLHYRGANMSPFPASCAKAEWLLEAEWIVGCHLMAERCWEEVGHWESLRLTWFNQGCCRLSWLRVDTSWTPSTKAQRGAVLGGPSVGHRGRGGSLGPASCVPLETSALGKSQGGALDSSRLVVAVMRSGLATRSPSFCSWRD